MPEALIIAKTDECPYVHFDSAAGIFKVEGRSLPEDVTKFYDPVCNWLLEYSKSPNQETKFVFQLEYFNSASARKIFEILSILEKIDLNTFKVEVIWSCAQEDDMMYSRGEEIGAITTLPFTLTQY